MKTHLITQLHQPFCRVVGVVSTIKGLSKTSSDRLPCDWIEVRLDHLLARGVSPQAVREALETRRHPVLLTLRSPSEGGAIPLDDRQRCALLRPLLEWVDAVDLELAHVSRLPLRGFLAEMRQHQVDLILSAHQFKGSWTPAGQVKILSAMNKYKPAVRKLALPCQTNDQLAALLLLQGRCKKHPTALMGMGKLAAHSRQLLPLLGARLAYGFLDEPVAPGQPDARTLAAYRASTIAASDSL